MNLKDIVLKEISVEDYVDLMIQTKKGLGLDRSKFIEDLRQKKAIGEIDFVRIIDPLTFGSYQDLLHCFKDGFRGRKASVRLKEGGWMRIKRVDLEIRNIEELSEIALDTGFMYVSFMSDDVEARKNQKNNEIAFECVLNGVGSVAISIPLTELIHYTLEGRLVGNYEHIRGIYVPS